MSNLERLQEWLRNESIDALVVPSADEYLSEFCQPFARRLEWTTGFKGSTGEAIILQRSAALFLDGRYRLQGQHETAGTGIEVLERSRAARARWLLQHLRRGGRLGIDGRLHSYYEFQVLRDLGKQQAVEIRELELSPIDTLWRADRPPQSSSTVYDYPVNFSGLPADEKCRQLAGRLSSAGIDWCLLADPEDVAWLLNIRTRDSLIEGKDGRHVVPIPLCRALVETSGRVLLFVDGSRLEPTLRERLEGMVTVLEPESFESVLAASSAGKIVAANLRRTPHRFGAIVDRQGTLKDDATVARWRWKKHPFEIECAKDGHFRDEQAVIRFLSWLQRTIRDRAITELDAARKLSELRAEIPGYLGPSMPLMSASGPSGAMAHYVPSEHSNRRLNDHPIYWVDSGGQYLGCSTDNTACISLGEPEQRHIRSHTLVVKGYIALACARFPVGTHSSQLDVLARQFLWNDGLDYSHGTGHGVGNFMNIHEGPYVQQDPSHPLVAPLEGGMIISNEPGHYVENDYGIRVESHLLTVPSKNAGFLEFETISRLPIDPRLIDRSLLTAAERRWLGEYHRRIATDYRGCFDEETSGWLDGVVAQYV